MFFDSVLTMEMNTAGLAGFWLEWTFDPFFSAQVAMDHDRDRNKIFSAAETEQIRVNAFANLENYGYFMWLTWRQKETRPVRVESFSVRQVDDRLVYRFFVPYAIQVKAGTTERLRVAIYDETFYSDVRYADPPVRPAGGTDIVQLFRVIRDSGRIVRYSTTDGNVATNLGTKDADRYTGTYQPPEIEVSLTRPSP